MGQLIFSWLVCAPFGSQKDNFHGGTWSLEQKPKCIFLLDKSFNPHMVLGQYMSVPMELARKCDEEHTGLRNMSTERIRSTNTQNMGMAQDGPGLALIYSEFVVSEVSCLHWIPLDSIGLGKLQCDVTVLPNPGIMVNSREIIPFMAQQFRLVNWYKLPRLVHHRSPGPIVIPCCWMTGRWQATSDHFPSGWEPRWWRSKEYTKAWYLGLPRM